jgi:FtsP/CotA-like multicopper oxidase with cupredoxin domain
VHQGDTVRIVLTNHLTQPTTIHWHGLTVPNVMDGVPYITQDPVMPDQTFTYQFRVVDPPGTYLYHSHFNSTEQVGDGLYGAFVIEPRHPSWGTKPDPNTKKWGVWSQVNCLLAAYQQKRGDEPPGIPGALAVASGGLPHASPRAHPCATPREGRLTVGRRYLGLDQDALSSTTSGQPPGGDGRHQRAWRPAGANVEPLAPTPIWREKGACSAETEVDARTGA